MSQPRRPSLGFVLLAIASLVLVGGAVVIHARELLWGLALVVAVVLLLAYVAVAGTRLYRHSLEAERDLRAVNGDLRRYAQAVRSTDNVVLIAGSDGAIEWVNHALERRTHTTLESLVGRPLADVLCAEDKQPGRTTADPRVLEAIAAGSSFHGELRLRSRVAETVWTVVDINPVHDEQGLLTGFVAVGTDVTETRRNAEMLREAKEAAEQTAMGKATFLATMSHEIRTPLNAVLGLTELLLLTDLDPTQRDYVRTAQSSGRMLLAQLNDVLDFSALESVRIDTEGRPFLLGPLLEDTVTMFSAESSRKGVPVFLDVADDVPEAVCGDETRIRQVLVNLVGNALKFTERGGVRLSVSTEVDRLPDGGLRFAVRDSGAGIAADRMSRLFQPFTQADASTTRKHGGTGLGLAICQLLAARMGGRIWVTSELGIGSCFYVELPLSAATDPVETAAAPGPTASSHLPQLEPPAPADDRELAVLVAEDDPVNQKVVVAMLRRLGVSPDVVADGRAAVSAVVHGRYDLVLMDVHMPEMDGIQAVHEIHEQLPPSTRPRIVAVTANALGGDREELLAAGMDGYISKPVSLDDLQAALTAIGAPPAASAPGKRAAARSESELPASSAPGRRAAVVTPA